MLLEANDIVAGYGSAAPILQGIGVTLDAGEMVAVIGPNGAGKSTLLKVMSGLLKPRGGRLELDGESIVDLPPREIARRGMVLVPQERNVFGTMSVRENLEVAGVPARCLIGSRSSPPSAPSGRATCRAASVRRWPWRWR